MSIAEDSRELRRRRLLVEAGEQTARVINDIVMRLHGTAAGIQFNSNALCIDKIVEDYFGRVDAFKGDNDFCEGDLINFSKIAGIFAITILEHKTKPLFLLSETMADSVYGRMIVPFFIYRLIGSILSLDLTRVSGEIENDLMRCLTLHPQIKADADWLFWSFKVLQIAYGNPALSAPDPAT